MTFDAVHHESNDIGMDEVNEAVPNTVTVSISQEGCDTMVTYFFEVLKSLRRYMKVYRPGANVWIIDTSMSVVMSDGILRNMTCIGL